MELSVNKIKRLLWLSGNLSYKLHSAQLDIYADINKQIAAGQKEFAMRIARQFGKSYLIVIMALEMCIKNPGIIVRILGPTLLSIKDIVDDNLQPIIEDAPPGFVQRMKSDRRYKVGKSSLRIGTLERAHIDTTARGGNASVIFCEECAASVRSEDLKYALESVINPQLLRSSAHNHGGMLFFVTTPAITPDHHFHVYVEPPLQQRGCFYMRNVYDNPQLNEDQIELAMQRCGGEQSEAWRREYLCELFRSENSVIIPEFDVNRHVKDIVMPTYKRLYTMIDFGGSRDHHHALLYYWDIEAKKLIFHDEVHEKNKTSTSYLVDKIKEMEKKDPYGPIARYGDLPGQLSVDLNQVMGFTIAQTAKDDRDAALSNLRNMFANDLILINPRCVMTIRTLLCGLWNSTRTDFQRTDTYGHCDAVDALLYASRNIDKTDPRPVVQPKTFVQRPQNTGFDRLGKMWK